MQSSNPVFRNSGTFNGPAARNAYGDTTYPGSGPYRGYATPPVTGYTDPSTWSVGTPGAGTRVDTRRMTIDSVVQRTAATLGLLVVGAVAAWVLVPIENVTVFYAAAFIGLALGLVNSFKRVVSPGLVCAYAIVEGVFIGAASKVFETIYPGVVAGAVLGTIAAVGGTLAAYRLLDIKVGDRFRKGVTAAVFGFVAVSLLDFVLAMFGHSFGFNGFGGLGLVSSAAGVVIGVLMLVLDFDYVERAIAVGAPERESWRAAFGLTVTIVWIYIELLRLLAILRGND